jgi:hypothetical protein
MGRAEKFLMARGEKGARQMKHEQIKAACKDKQIGDVSLLSSAGFSSFLAAREISRHDNAHMYTGIRGSATASAPASTHVSHLPLALLLIHLHLHLHLRRPPPPPTSTVPALALALALPPSLRSSPRCYSYPMFYCSPLAHTRAFAELVPTS